MICRPITLTFAVLSTLTPATAAAPGLLAPIDHWTRDDAAHLLRRAGFGGTPRQIDELHALGPAAAVDLLVDYHRLPEPTPPYHPIDTPDRPQMRRLLAGLSDRDRQQRLQQVRALHACQMARFRAWWLHRMITTNRPFEEKMILFWHGHFTTGAREVKNSEFIIRQHDFLRRNALASFRELVLGISQDPAMLVYLDNVSNRRQHPNENYARELLELFTMGEGNYSETDVTEAARALTGWTIGPDGFRFARAWHDNGVKTFLGRSGNFDGRDIIDIILAQPATAEHLARRLLTFFLTPDPPDNLVRALAEQIRRSNYDMRTVMRTLLSSRAFYDPRYRHSLIKSPVELVVGSVRLLEMPPDDPWSLVAACRDMGQQLYQPPNVKGWDGGLAWINTGWLFERYNFAASLLRGSDAGALRRLRRRDARFREAARALADTIDHGRAMPPPPPPDIPFRSRPPFDPEPIIRRAGLTDPQAIVDHFIDRLLQMPIDPSRRRTLRAILPDRDTIDPRRDRESIVALVNAIMNMPEYQLN